jgi:hypothetical protein
MTYKPHRSYVPTRKSNHQPYREHRPMASRQMNLASSDNRTRFLKMLDKAERHVDAELTEWESAFVKDMRRWFNTREDAEDLGQTPWSPSVNQWNTLHGIVSKL